MHLSAISLLLLSLSLPSSSSPLSPRDNCNSTPGSCDCTNTSFSSWAWNLSAFYFHSSVVFSTPAHQIDGGYVSFNLTNPAVAGVVTECAASSTQLDDWFYGDQWYTCTGDAPAGVSAQFRFDRVTGRVDVNQSWVCDDDPVYPYVLAFFFSSFCLARVFHFFHPGFGPRHPVSGCKRPGEE